MAVKFVGFRGELPRVEPYYLPETAAVEAMDAAMLGGSLTPFHEPSAPVQTLSNDRLTIYLHEAEWLSWADVVDVVPGPVATDRLYMTRDGGSPRMWFSGSEFTLRLPNPTTVITIARNGTLDEETAVRVAYAFTWVTTYGEETGPSPLSNTVRWSEGNTIDISGMPATPPVSGRGITKKRIYRAITSEAGATELFFVDEVDATDTNYSHNISTHPPAEAITTKDFDPVPDNLRGLTAMPNGIMAGFAGKELFFCEPYQPHAWPSAYSLTMNDFIVGLAAFGTTLAVLTTGQPYIVQGMHPDQMTSQKLDQPYPCLSKRGIVDMGYGAVYPSTDGLVVVTEREARHVTKNIWTAAQWRAMQPTSMMAARFGDLYGFTFTPASGGPAKHIALIDPSLQEPTVLRASDQPSGLYAHTESGRTFMLGSDRRTIRAFDDPTMPRRIARWRSKPIRLDYAQSFGAVRIDTDGGAGAITMRVYADGNLIRTVTRANSDERLPAGAHRTWQIEMEGDATVIRAALGRTFAELND